MSNERKFNILRGVIITSNLEREEQAELIDFINHIECTGHIRTIEEVQTEIDDLEKRRCLADYMDWGAYRDLTRQIEELKKELNELIGTGE